MTTEQDAIDLEDALLRLRRVRQLIKARDEAEEKVRTLIRELKYARRKLTESGWNLAACLGAERKKGEAKQCSSQS